MSRFQAQTIGREMLEMGLIEQVDEVGVDFKDDDNVYYRFNGLESNNNENINVDTENVNNVNETQV